MKAEYIKLIRELDLVISHVRTLQIEEHDSRREVKWRTRLHELLDERLRLMRLRDTA